MEVNGKRYIVMEENDDETVTITVAYDDEGGTVVAPMSMFDFIEQMGGFDGLEERSEKLMDIAVLIPDLAPEE